MTICVCKPRKLFGAKKNLADFERKKKSKHLVFEERMSSGVVGGFVLFVFFFSRLVPRMCNSQIQTEV